jgi:fructose-1,6-bisphosphatase/inositol monophosphatase family enzyme
VSLIERVNAILRGVVATVVMPSFRALRPEDIQSKHTPGDPDDLVTSADRAAERYLIDALRELVPGAAFIGEEAVSENPSLLAALSGSAPAWLIDPIDGTKNFARGASDFGVMVALVEAGVTRASWIAVPAAQPSGYVVSAEIGLGTSIDGVRVSPVTRIASTPRGTIHTRMMPGDTAADVQARLRGKFAPLPSTGAAATEYSAIVRGDKDFVIYYRLLPWDHAPGALAITEAGGAAVHVTGERYAPLSPNQVTIFAATAEIAETIRASLI